MTVRIHPDVVGQVAQSQSRNPRPRLTSSSAPCPLVSDVLCQLYCRFSSNTVFVVHTLDACVPTLGTPSSAPAPFHKPPSQWPNWTATVILGHKPGCPETGSGGDRPPRGHMPRPVLSFPSRLLVMVLRRSWPNSMLTPALLLHAPPPLIAAEHALGLPTAAAIDTPFHVWLTRDHVPLCYTPLLISCLTVPLSRFFVIIYLWTVLFTPCFGL